MKTTDWITLIIGLIWGIIILILWRRSESKMWPRIFGIGSAVYAFAIFMMYSILLWPLSGFARNAILTILISLIFGIVGHISGRELARRFSNEKDYNHRRK